MATEPKRLLSGADAPNINSLWGTLIVEELVRNGVDMFCVSPGSRSTPLALAVADHPRARSLVHFDERGAAYHALGWVKAAGRPAALICTSGTAVANYWPAVVEAAQSCVPLIVLTADRPPELLDTGANQAVDQTRIFGGYVRWQAALPCPDEAVAPNVLLTTIDQAVFRARRAPAGPVHVNCMFREPLAPEPSGRKFGAYLARVETWRRGSEPYTSYPLSEPRLLEDLLHQILAKVTFARQGILVVGALCKPVESEAVFALAQALNWPVFPDVASGLRLGAPDAPFVPYYDQLLLLPKVREVCAPDVVLQIGTPVTSKRWIEHLAFRRPPTYILVASHTLRHDPAHQVTLRIEADIVRFCEWLAASVHAAGSQWLDTFRACSATVDKTVDEFLSRQNALTEPGVARLLSRELPARGVLFLGNSMPIRDMNMFGAAAGARVRVGVNRGASGIDGNVATAAGYANALGTPVTALIGDMALLHDLNSLALLQHMAAPVIVVVINNNGGGIFSFLPVAAFTEHFEPFFAAPHGLRFPDAAKLFNLDYYGPANVSEFVWAYRDALRAQRSAIIEVTTDRARNLEVHRALQDAVVAALEAVAP